MWMLPTAIMCGNHRSGEHNEIHKHMPSLKAGHKLDGRFRPFVAIELHSITSRHEELALTLNHASPLPPVPNLKAIYPQHWGKTVDLKYNLLDLRGRCPKCQALMDSNPAIVNRIMNRQKRTLH